MDKKEHALLIKLVKKIVSIKRCYTLCIFITPILLTTDIILFFVQKDNLNICLSVSLLAIAVILVIVSFILASQINLLRELKDWFLNKDNKW